MATGMDSAILEDQIYASPPPSPYQRVYTYDKKIPWLLCMLEIHIVRFMLLSKIIIGLNADRGDISHFPQPQRKK